MNDTIEINFREIATVLWKRAWIIVLCIVLMASAVLVYTVNFVTPMYTAEVTIYVNNNSNKNNTAISSADLAVALRLVATYINIIKSEQVLGEVVEKTGLNLRTEDIRRMMTSEAVGETEMFYIRVTSPNPQMSMDLANAIADVAPGKISAIIEGSSAKVIDYARLPAGRSSPNYTVNTVVGAIVGGMLSVAVIAVYAILDTRIKDEEALNEISAIPVLGKIPDMYDAAEANTKKARR